MYYKTFLLLLMRDLFADCLHHIQSKNYIPCCFLFSNHSLNNALSVASSDISVILFIYFSIRSSWALCLNMNIKNIPSSIDTRPYGNSAIPARIISTDQTYPTLRQNPISFPPMYEVCDIFS